MKNGKKTVNRDEKWGKNKVHRLMYLAAESCRNDDICQKTRSKLLKDYIYVLRRMQLQ